MRPLISARHNGKRAAALWLNRFAGAVVGFLNPCLGREPLVIHVAKRAETLRIKNGRRIKGLPVSYNAGRYRTLRCWTLDHHNTHGDFLHLWISLIGLVAVKMVPRSSRPKWNVVKDDFEPFPAGRHVEHLRHRTNVEAPSVITK